MNAHRRSPARPCHETSTSSSLSAAMDFTGYRHSPATRPTTVITHLHQRGGALVDEGGPSVADSVRRSASRPSQHAIDTPSRTTACTAALKPMHLAVIISE